MDEILTVEQNKELRQQAKWAESHGNGQIAIPASLLLELLPALPPEPAAELPVVAEKADLSDAPPDDTRKKDTGDGIAAAVAPAPAAEVSGVQFPARLDALTETAPETK